MDLYSIFLEKIHDKQKAISTDQNMQSRKLKYIKIKVKWVFIGVEIYKQ
jgi:hypothetical protein